MSAPTFAELYAAFARFNPEHVKRRLDTLAHNLAVGGALCKAFDLGDERRLAIENTTTRSEWIAARRDEWHPGCGRSAP